MFPVNSVTYPPVTRLNIASSIGRNLYHTHIYRFRLTLQFKTTLFQVPKV